MSRALGEEAGRKSAKMIKFKYMFLITILTGSFIYLTSRKGIDFILIDNNAEVPLVIHHYEISDNQTDERYTIATKGCKIPAMKSLDDSIIKIVKYPNKLKPCPDSNFTLLGYDDKKIWIKRENIAHYNISKHPLTCCYQSFERPDTIKDITSKQIDNRASYGTCKTFNKTILVKHEFVKVTCSAKNKNIYEQYFVFTPRKKFIEHNGKKEIVNDDSAYNVLIIGIDSVSRLNFHRTMPKTADYLKNKGAVELLGYNKVADNTFPNVVPMLLGLKDTELKKTCYPHNKATFDNCPFIWEWFKQKGYYTALGEDTSTLGTFNYLKSGFANTPTDYYLHTFIQEAEHKVGKIKDFNSYLCMHDTYFYKVLLNYVQNLTTTLNDKKLFGFFWEVSMSHDYLNYPMVMDNDYLQFFDKLEKADYLNNTIVFLVSDHGMRWGEIRSTKQGRLEERLPFILILTPESFRQTYKEAQKNLNLNTKRLTSPFDIYATLTDLINAESLSNEAIASRRKSNYADDRSISLFLPIPDNRTCSSIGIADHWCTCLREVKLSKNDTFAVAAASNLTSLINSMLREYPQCATLTLTELLDAVELHAGKDSEKSKVRWRDFMVVIKTTPGEAIFEATLRHDGKNWKLMGTPSRLNLYGDQSRCVDDTQLKLYCYCGEKKQ